MNKKQVLLRLEHITKRFPGVVALDDVQFTLCEGEIHALLGENGAGKSTLIKVLTGVERRDHGTIVMEEKEISPDSPQEAQKYGISTVYQEVNLCPNLSVAENVYLGRQPMRGGRIDWKNMNRNAGELLSRFDLDLDVTLALDHYSVAVQQMIAIARAADISARVLILDEPTSSLSALEAERLFAIMRKLRQQDMGIIFVTHFLDQVYEVSDTITVLRNGGYVGTWEAESLPKIELVGKMIGKDYDVLRQIAPVASSRGCGKEVLLEVTGASVAGTIRDLDLTVNKGEILGISGLLGSGRSETVRMIFGIDPMESGTLLYKTENKKIKDPLEAIRCGFAFCPEDRKTEGIVGDLPIRENIILALQAKRGIFKAISRPEAERLADEYIKRLDIKTPSADQLMKNLSGGNQQKVIIARWMATNPDLLMLDEPTRGIDIGTKAEIQRIAVEQADGGMSVIFISSELDEMLRCCERMVILRERRKVIELTADEISESAIMKYIAGGVGDEEVAVSC